MDSAGLNMTDFLLTSSEGYIPYNEIPALTISMESSGTSIIPALLSQWCSGIFTPFSSSCRINRQNCSYWLCVIFLSEESEDAKCVKIPSILIYGSFAILMTSFKESSLTRNPILPIPVSTLIWIFA